MLNDICIDYNLTYKIPCLIRAKIKLYYRYKIIANEAASTTLILQQYMVRSCKLPQRILKEYKYKRHCKIKKNYEFYKNVWFFLCAPCRHRNAVVWLHSFLTLALNRGVSYTLCPSHLRLYK